MPLSPRALTTVRTSSARQGVRARVIQVPDLTEGSRYNTVMTAPNSPRRIDRSVLSIKQSFEDPETVRFWHAQTPEARLRHVEELRRLNYGHRASSGLQRVLEITRG